jgi:hypothetical protein
MPYIGKTPLTGAYQLCDAITTSATATYNLTVGSSPVIPGAAQNCIVSLNGVIQAPVSAYTVSGSTIVFASTLSATDVIDFILILGNVFDIGKPTDGSVTNASIANSTIDLTTKVTGVLPVANGGTNLSSGFANGITQADQWRITAALTGTGAVITANWERADTNSPGLIGTGMTQSSGRFTFPSTGIYLVNFGSYVTATATRDYAGAYIMVSTDGGSNFSAALEMFGSVNVINAYDQLFGSLLLDVTNTTNIKVEFNIAASGSTSYDGATGNNRTYATFIRLGDT